MEEYFIYVGRLDELKGVKILFETWKNMGQQAPNLMVCGIGPLKDWCEGFIDEHCCNIEMRGLVTNAEARQLISNAVALILPTQWYEGFPMTILEALSVGTPVIGSDLGNVGSIIQDNVTGIRFCYDDPESLSQAVNRLRQNSSFSKERIMKVFEQNYSADANYRQLNQIYQIAIGLGG